MSAVGFLTALAAGLLSFLSPCVLPLIPAYLSFVSGYGLADIRSGSGRFRVFARTLAFAAGFAIVFTALGLLFSGASMLLGGLSRSITLIAGILVIAVTVAWSATPLGVIILLAGLEGIPRDLYEQSLIDGANRIKQFTSITLPLLRPAIAIVLLNGAVVSIGLFDQVYVLVGLDQSKVTLGGQIYVYAFRDFNFGFGYAASVIATLITAAISVVYLKLIYREEEY